LFDENVFILIIIYTDWVDLKDRFIYYDLKDFIYYDVTGRFFGSFLVAKQRFH
jgi:hypothetical protein